VRWCNTPITAHAQRSAVIHLITRFFPAGWYKKDWKTIEDRSSNSTDRFIYHLGFKRSNGSLTWLESGLYFRAITQKGLKVSITKFQVTDLERPSRHYDIRSPKGIKSSLQTLEVVAMGVPSEYAGVCLEVTRFVGLPLDHTRVSIHVYKWHRNSHATSPCWQEVDNGDITRAPPAFFIGVRPRPNGRSESGVRFVGRGSNFLPTS